MTIRLWDVAKGAELKTLQGPESSIPAIAYSPDGLLLASGSADNLIRIWKLGTDQVQFQMAGHQGGVRSLAFFPKGDILVSGGNDLRVRLWDMENGSELERMEAKAAVQAVAVSRDARWLAYGGDDQSVWLWDPYSSRPPVPLCRHMGTVEAISFSPDGSLLASASWDRTARILELPEGRLRHEIKSHAGGVKAVQFSPDGQFLATASSGGINLWCTKLWRLVRQLRSSEKVTMTIRFSPDGRLLATGGSGQVVRAWDVATGSEQLALSGHRGLVLCLAWSPDGKVLATASSGGSILTTTAPWQESKLFPRSQSLSDAELGVLWEELASGDVRNALRARRVLIGCPARSLTLLTDRLHPAPPFDAESAFQLANDLYSNEPERSERAAKAVLLLGDRAESVIQAALTARPSEALRSRLEKLLEEAMRFHAGHEFLRIQRAVDILAAIGSAEARQLLESLAAGEPDAFLTYTAQAGLKRLTGEE